jgi:kynurenine formamidase
VRSELDKVAYDGRGGASPRWWPSRYGVDDQAGACNELTPERTLAALSLPRTGQAIELGQLLEPGIPTFPPRTFNQLILAHGVLESLPVAPGENDVNWFEEQVVQPYQICCHVDGLGHVGIRGHFYNGNHYKDFYAPLGLTKLGIENTRPWIARGVCLDVAALERVTTLPAGYVITPEHLEEACRRQELEIRPGDAVLVHTGWAELWMRDNETYGSVEPGVGWDGAHWLTERRPSLVGADNWSFEPLPFENPKRPYIVHQHLIAETGTYILENIRTAALVEGRHHEFLFVLTVPKVRGATAGLAAPVAVV